MKLYLSSFQLGDNPQRLSELFGENKRVGVILNALDCSSDLDRVRGNEQLQFDGLSKLGLIPERLDLREYFGKREKLEEKLSTLGGVWVHGGNTFVLASAYKQSGFDELLREKLIDREEFVYAGFSAGACVLQHKMKGLDFVDDPHEVKDAYGEDGEILWNGVGLLDFVFVPHFASDHPESEDTDPEVEYYQINKMPYKTLRDGEVLVGEVLKGSLTLDRA